MAKQKTLINVSAGPSGAVYKLTATAANKLSEARDVLKAIHPVLPDSKGAVAKSTSEALASLLTGLGVEPEKVAVAGSTTDKQKVG